LKSILISGDSFSADWREAGKTGDGWVNKLARKYHVTNLSQAGCSEYKILKQLYSVNLSEFDHIIISHTSPYRLPVEKHPVHRTGFHKDADIIYSDIYEAYKERPGLEPLVKYFENFMSVEYQEFVHGLICKEINSLVKNYNVTHMTHMKWQSGYKFFPMLDFYKIWKNNRGDVNHYNKYGNDYVFSVVDPYIQLT
tara:strand:- start:1972 stop:2559 length:588 start_codon:yes stop_codon:yes gene_type:complete